jgi:hypothetical protein
MARRDLSGLAGDLAIADRIPASGPPQDGVAASFRARMTVRGLSEFGVAEVLQDYTTLYCHVFRVGDDGAQTEVGIAYLKFRTFEDLAAAGNLTGFLSSFQATGTNNPLLQWQAQMRFLAFTGQFVQREYDPLAP